MPRRIVDLIFRCCLGQRQSHQHDEEDEAGPSDPARAGQSNERMPLLAGQRSSGMSKSKSKDGRGDQPAHAVGIRNEDNRQAHSKQVGDQNAASTTAADAPEKRTINAQRLKAIREQAQSAYFDVESSQLLPSSSSLAQRQASMGASQRLNRRDEALTATRMKLSKKNDGKTAGIDDLTLQRNSELVAASDRAERLYSAALSSEARMNGDVGGMVGAAPADKESDREHIDPVGIVRPVHLAIHDDGAVSARTKTSNRAPGDRDHLSVKGPSSPQGSNGRAPDSRGLSEQMHSLRTLQLRPVDTITAASGEFEEDFGSKLLSAPSRQSSTAELDASYSPASSSAVDRSADDDEEEWGRRGRTRSKRGLIWLDTTNAAGNHASSRSPQEHPTDGRLGEGDKRSEGSAGNKDEIDQTIYGLRFETQASQARHKMSEHLLRSVDEPLTEVWDTSMSTTQHSTRAPAGTTTASVSEV